MADYSQIHSIPYCLTDPEERENYVSALQLVSLDGQLPQTQPPVPNTNLRPAEPEEPPTAASSPEVPKTPSHHHHHPKQPNPPTPPLSPPPTSEITAETTTHKTALFFTALLRIMIAGPPYYPCRSVTRYAHTMLINGAADDDWPGITACSHAMLPGVLDRAVAGLVAQRRYVLEWRGAAGAGRGGVEGAGGEWLAAVGAFEESLGRWIEVEAEKEREGRGRTGRRRRMEEWGRRGGVLDDDDDDAASRFSFEM